MDETNYDCFPNRKLKFICDKNKIPVSLNPTREELLRSIHAFHSAQSKEQWAQSNLMMTTPTVQPNNGKRRRILQSPYVTHRSPKSPRSFFGMWKESECAVPCSRSPTPNIRKTKDKCVLLSEVILALVLFVFLLSVIDYFL